MAAEDSKYPERLSVPEVQSTIGTIMKLVILSVLFVVVGYALIWGSFYIEQTQLHPLIDQFAHEHTKWSLAGGGPDRAGMSQLNDDLAQMHKLGPLGQTTLWMKLGGVGHILVGIFISLIAIVRILSLMPHRLSYEMERARELTSDLDGTQD